MQVNSKIYFAFDTRSDILLSYIELVVWAKLSAAQILDSEVHTKVHTKVVMKVDMKVDSKAE